MRTCPNISWVAGALRVVFPIFADGFQDGLVTHSPSPRLDWIVKAPRGDVLDDLATGRPRSVRMTSLPEWMTGRTILRVSRANSVSVACTRTKYVFYIPSQAQTNFRPRGSQEAAEAAEAAEMGACR